MIKMRVTSSANSPHTAAADASTASATAFAPAAERIEKVSNTVSHVTTASLTLQNPALT